jgi:FixJ family two-component response regulator
MTTAATTIVFLDDSDDLREVMPVLLEAALGVKCMCYGTLMEFQNHSTEVLLAKVAILDINLGPDAPDGVAAFNWLMEHGFEGNVLFFTGHARTNPQVAEAIKKGVEILEKPVDPETLISFLERALGKTHNHD